MGSNTIPSRIETGMRQCIGWVYPWMGCVFIYQGSALP
jgi:hypothetical protein